MLDAYFKTILLLFFTFNLFNKNVVNCNHIFASNADLEQLVTTEKIHLISLEKYIEESEDRLNQLNRYNIQVDELYKFKNIITF